jgi:hypothetical protein
MGGRGYKHLGKILKSAQDETHAVLDRVENHRLMVRDEGADIPRREGSYTMDKLFARESIQPGDYHADESAFESDIITGN